jgi:hypothetical protein
MWAQDSGNAVSQNTVYITGILNNAMSRLSLRYQLRTGDSHLTLEESQTIGNRYNHLQKLIGMFEHQANGFLLHHQPTDDLLILSLGNYEEYDHVNDMDDSGVSGLKVQ